MRLARVAIAAVALLAGTATAFAFELTVTSVTDGHWDKRFVAGAIAGCDGGNVSPALSWRGAPPGTASFALTLFDPDARGGRGWWHWLVWDIPADVTGFQEGAVPAGAVEGRGTIGRRGYLGPCPPPGSGTHRYTFTLYALKVARLPIDPWTSTGPYVAFTLASNAIAEATVVAGYRR